MIGNILIVILCILGLVFFFGTAVGVIRFPDLYTRTHAAAKGDTLSTMLFLLAFAIYEVHHFTLEEFLIALKLLNILVFIAIASPTASHALINAGFVSKIPHWTPKDVEGGTEERE